MGFRIEKVTKDQLDELAKLFGVEPVTNDCWCMWYITSVKDFNAAGSAGNREKFYQMVESSDLPMGFPFSGSQRRSGGAIQVGFETVFSACGFRTIRTPSPSRVVMRRQLKEET